MRRAFSTFASKAATASGHWLAFTVALLIVVTWTIGGFFVGFNNATYQLYINSGTTIITFLMVFLLANAQNRGDAAMQLKLDELLRAVPQTDMSVIPIEDADEDVLRARLAEVAKEAEKVEEAE